MTEPTSDIPQWNPTENSNSGYKDFYKPQGSIEFRIDRFTEFTQGNGKKSMRWSALTYIRGLPWQITAYPIEMGKSKSLAFYLDCKYKSASAAWSCKGSKRIYRVLSQKEGADDYVECPDEPQTYNENCSGWGYKRFFPIDELLDPQKGFIKDDTVILQMDLTADIPHGIQKDDEANRKAHMDVFGSINKNRLFSSLTGYQWDFVLVVQEKSVHVLKSILSLHSEYFKEKFAEDIDCESAILHDIDYEEFVELLCVVYPTLRPITVENVETVAKLAHIFKMKGVLQQCEVVLMVNISKFGRIRTFLLSHWYGMDHLQSKCVEQLSDLKQLRNELEFAALDCRTKVILMDKIIERSSNSFKIVGYCPKKSLANVSTTKNVVDSDQESDSNARASDILTRLASSVMAHKDGVLIVENKKIPIHKTHSALYSKYFNTLFLGEFKEKNQDEIVLEEVGHTDMLELLAVIYPCNYPVTDENLEVILKLADRFIMPEILERCKEVLKSSKKIKRSLKLYLAQLYNFTDVQIEYAKEYKSVEDVKTLKTEPEYELINEETRALIFDSICDTS